MFRGCTGFDHAGFDYDCSIGPRMWEPASELSPAWESGEEISSERTSRSPAPVLSIGRALPVYGRSSSAPGGGAISPSRGMLVPRRPWSLRASVFSPSSNRSKRCRNRPSSMLPRRKRTRIWSLSLNASRYNNTRCSAEAILTRRLPSRTCRAPSKVSRYSGMMVDGKNWTGTPPNT